MSRGVLAAYLGSMALAGFTAGVTTAMLVSGIPLTAIGQLVAIAWFRA